MTVFRAQAQLVLIERQMNSAFNASQRLEMSMLNCRIHEDQKKLAQLATMRDKALARLDFFRTRYSELETLAICLAAN
jgi:hypothetical protein